MTDVSGEVSVNQPIAHAVGADGYDRVISFDRVYHSGSGDLEAGFCQGIALFKELFG